MLMSLGKSAPITEMFPLRKAPPPPELNVSLRASSFFQFEGMVQLIPAWSHFTVCPFAIAANCAAVGEACSTGSPFTLVPEDEEFELRDFLKRSLKLQPTTTRNTAMISGMRFIGFTPAKIGKARRFYFKTRHHVKQKFPESGALADQLGCAR